MACSKNRVNGIPSGSNYSFNIASDRENINLSFSGSYSETTNREKILVKWLELHLE